MPPPQKPKQFSQHLLSIIEDMFREHKQQIVQMNKEAEKRGNKKVQKVKSDPKISANFYKYVQDTAQRLRIINKKLAQSQKFKKERRDIFSHKITAMNTCLVEILDQRNINLTIDDSLLKAIKQNDRVLEDLQTQLILFEKQSKGFCFGAEKNTKVSLEKSLVDMISFYQFWHLIPRVSPEIQVEIHGTFIPLQYEETVFNDIDKMVMSIWPQPQKIEVPVEKIIQRVVFKEVPPAKGMSELNKLQSQIRELEKKNDKTQNQLARQRKIREAHEWLVGIGRSQNVTKAVDIYRSVPELGSQNTSSLRSSSDLKINPLICNILGSLYESGSYLPKDMKKAVEYYIKSASVQDPQGLYKIGKYLEKKMVNVQQLFDRGYANRKEEIRDVIEHYQKAAQKGHLDAITDLGHIYENGVKEEQERQQNSVVSKSLVSSSKEEGGRYVIQPNFQIAVKYYLKAKKQQFPRALNNIGALYVRANQNIPQTIKGSNLQKGIKYLRMATELRYPKAYLNLGKCYESGLGIKKNIEKAKALYIQGADLGDFHCKLQYVKCMINHDVKQKSVLDPKVVDYLRQITINDPNNAQGMYMMGVFQEKGIGVEKNKEAAFYYISRSANLNFSLAEIKMGDFYYSGYFVDKNFEKARIWYQKAAAKNNSKAFINLGLLYEKGLIGTEGKITQNILAKNYYIQAAKMGNPDAFIFLNSAKPAHIQSDNMRQAAQLGSEEALKILAKTSSTVRVQNSSRKKGKEEYRKVLNHYIKEANKSNEGQKGIPKTEDSHRGHSPRVEAFKSYFLGDRNLLSQNTPSIRHNSPKSYGQTLNRARSSEYFSSDNQY